MTNARRLAWLDVLRALCAIQILGFHWLRACLSGGFVANPNLPEGYRSLVWAYRDPGTGWATPGYLWIDGTQGFTSWLNNSLGLLLGFGWEAVHVFILISGFSLGLSLKDWPTEKGYWRQWYGKRIRRVLTPYYLAVLLLGGGVLVLWGLLPLLPQALSQKLGDKLAALLGTDIWGFVVSQIFLVNPWQPQGIANFLAPAWWFIPAIVMAYVAFPLLAWVLTHWGAGILLGGTAVLSIGSYVLQQQNILLTNTWYFILTMEAFPFALGLVWGWQKAKLLPVGTTTQLVAAFALLIFGNIGNWFSWLYPLSSLCFTPGLFLVGLSFSRWIQDTALAKQLSKVDSYNLYLLHQPLALPLALALSSFLGAYTVFVGWWLYLMLALGLTILFSQALSWIESRLLGSG